jgi:alkanesulfonate monooxygenase SsuD/methylene tetrahydromethanopterin reductase-like flavin-dependent oxidoreductase (luciferase family)
MKFTAFHLMAYRPLDLEAAKAHRSAWVVTPNTFYDPKAGADLYESYINHLVSAEALGFDVIAVNEHHQTAYGLMPAPNLIASTLIARTKHVKVAVIGRALPLVSNPVNIAEEYAMLDVMSRGRIIAGMVRGIGAEYHSTGVNPAHSHDRFHEAHDLIVQAWTKPGPFEFEGDHYRFRYVNLWPRPYQTPHPPIWIPSQGSTETVVWASHPDRKYPFLVTFAPEQSVVRYLGAYRDQARKYGYEPAPEQMGWAAPIYVAETDEQAKAEAAKPAETLFNNFLPMPWEMLLPAGYTSNASLRMHMKMRGATLGSKPTAQTIDGLMAIGTVVVGSPATVRARIEKMREQTGLGNLVCMMQFGTMSDAHAKKSMELFASEVMPKLR